MFSLEPKKGDYAAATLAIADIVSSNLISDVYFKSYANLKSVVVALRSTQGDQKIGIVFNIPTDYTGAADLQTTTFIEKEAYANFVFDHILLVDQTGSIYSIKESDMSAAFSSSMSQFTVTLVTVENPVNGGSIVVPQITPGTYTSVTVDSKGRVVAGSNPSTIVSYASQSQVASLQAQINNIISNSDPANLDSLSEVVAAFQAADSTLNGAITSLASSASSAVAAEQARAEAAESALSSSINGVSASVTSISTSVNSLKLIGAGMYEAVVGSSAQVAAGQANYTSIQSAINAISANQSVLILSGTYSENVTINKSCVIVGKGNSSVINGSVSFNSSADYCSLSKIRVTGNMTINAGADYNSILELWFAASSVITDNGASNNIAGIQD